MLSSGGEGHYMPLASRPGADTPLRSVGISWVAGFYPVITANLQSFIHSNWTANNAWTKYKQRDTEIKATPESYNHHVCRISNIIQSSCHTTITLKQVLLKRLKLKLAGGGLASCGSIICGRGWGTVWYEILITVRAQCSPAAILSELNLGAVDFFAQDVRKQASQYISHTSYHYMLTTVGSTNHSVMH